MPVHMLPFDLNFNVVNVDSVAFFDEVESGECTHGAPVVKMDILSCFSL